MRERRTSQRVAAHHPRVDRLHFGLLTGVFTGYRERPSTVDPWFTVGKSALANLDPIIGVVKPVFTRKKLARYRVRQICSINISALQAAAASDAE